MIQVVIQASCDLDEDLGDLVRVWWIVPHTVNPDLRHAGSGLVLPLLWFSHEKSPPCRDGSLITQVGTRILLFASKAADADLDLSLRIIRQHPDVFSSEEDAAGGLLPVQRTRARVAQV
ncbi:hypothetical protein LWP59_34550 [Amycolatopsis acidiphila]|uniref:Uncharacterized protein n=1 Tax=Amycolatopsis acidiphila TaxID=715473 RepID=A0A558A0K5_9PSEU|nr:hypothetical protein [Amycolatopsis acidiphila]TVT17789.1 hypothetical protein FNH06_30060 [Amycolatopsis acidiphila]UIJ59125.1 hypothetical protein LWP59_34550 [Amycolatopsis acidiphila]